MESKFLEIKKLVQADCYKAIKFKNTPKAACDFGFTSMQAACKNCRWMTLTKLSVGKQPLVIEKELTSDEVDVAKLEYLTAGPLLIEGPEEK